MAKLIIDNEEYEIADEVSDLIVMISQERDELKETLKANKEPVATVLCSAGLDAKDKENRRLETLLNPRLWDEEMNKAWHENIPDIQAAFKALKKCGI